MIVSTMQGEGNRDHRSAQGRSANGSREADDKPERDPPIPFLPDGGLRLR
jgi:hypothetical protein